MLSRSSPISEPTCGIHLLVAGRNHMGSQLLAVSLAPDPRFEIVAVASAADVFSMVTTRQPHVAFRRFLLPLRLRLARSEAQVGKIARDTKSDPANPNWHYNAFYRHMPAEEEANCMAESYQRKHCCGDEAKDS